MTNEEAIKILKSKMDGSVDTSYEWAETVRMAIKALEQEPVLGKIRAEIEAIIGEKGMDDYDFCSGLICTRNIIDKYKESEGEDMTRKEAETFCRLNMDSRAHDKILMHCIDEQYNMLDKIRAEIEQLTSRYTISRERGGMGQVEWSDRLIKESEVIQIIDKYKESEVEE